MNQSFTVDHFYCCKDEEQFERVCVYGSSCHGLQVVLLEDGNVESTQEVLNRIDYPSLFSFFQLLRLTSTSKSMISFF